MIGVGKARFATLDGCDKALVVRAVRSGRLPTLSDGSIDPALAGTVWRRGNVGRAAPPIAATQSIDGPEAAKAQAAEDLIEQHGVFETRAEAERHRDSYIARLRQIEFDLKSGQVVETDQVTREVGAQFASLRTKLLAIPTGQAPHLFRARSVPELEAALSRLVTRALEALSA